MAATSLVRELSSEGGLTPLHLAAYSGSENVVRGLLNSPAVQVGKNMSDIRIGQYNNIPLNNIAGKFYIRILFFNFSTKVMEIKNLLLHNTESF